MNEAQQEGSSVGWRAVGQDLGQGLASHGVGGATDGQGGVAQLTGPVVADICGGGTSLTSLCGFVFTCRQIVWRYALIWLM